VLFPRLASYLLAFLAMLSYSSILGATLEEGDKFIAEIATVQQSSLSSYRSHSLTGSPASSFVRGDKLVVLSRSAEVARILLGDGSEAFVSARSLGVWSKVTLADATAKVLYFEKMAEEQATQASYWERQAAAWVALVSRTLGARSEAASLPAPVSIFEPSLTESKLVVENDTLYTIRLYLTGSRTVSKTIRPGASWEGTFPPGSYSVVAEVTSGNVRPLRTTWKLEKGFNNEIRLYIR
jgi:hypothetical protein